MGSGPYLKKGGCVSQVGTGGSGLYLKPYKGRGLQSYDDGLYLKQGGKLYDGKGLLLGPNGHLPIYLFWELSCKMLYVIFKYNI